jgi:hypothetical protein
MAIDDPKAAFKEQYLGDEKFPVSLVVFGTKLVFPKVAFLLDVFNRVYDRFQKPTVEERIKAMFELLVQETEHLESRIDDTNASKVSADDLQEAIQLVIRHDAEEFNDKKRERYVKLVGNAVRSQVRIQDLATFVQTIEQLGERDVAVKVLNKIMNKEGDWTNTQSAPPTIWKIHPNIFIQRRQELAAQIAKQLGQRTDLPLGQIFSHEEGYEICTRLQGFGLAHEIEVSPREVPIGDYCFRLSNRGLTLLKLIGEDVPNSTDIFMSSDN